MKKPIKIIIILLAIIAIGIGGYVGYKQIFKKGQESMTEPYLLKKHTKADYARVLKVEPWRIGNTCGLDLSAWEGVVLPYAMNGHGKKDVDTEKEFYEAFNFKPGSGRIVNILSKSEKSGKLRVKGRYVFFVKEGTNELFPFCIYR